MARARNLKPSFFTNDKLAELPPLTRLLFAGLWTVADREGRLEDRPLKIKAEVLPYDNCKIDRMLQDLHGHGFILRYTVAGTRYIQVVKFLRHQNPHQKEAPSTIPPPTTALDESGTEYGISTVPAPDKNGAKTETSTVPSTQPAEEIPERARRVVGSGFPHHGVSVVDAGRAGDPTENPRSTPMGDRSPGKSTPKINGAHWWDTQDGVIAHGKERGIPARSRETHAEYKERLFRAEYPTTPLPFP